MSEAVATVAEVAAYLKVKRTTVYAMIRRGGLAAAQTSKGGAYRIRWEDVHALFQNLGTRSPESRPTRGRRIPTWQQLRDRAAKPTLTPEQWKKRMKRRK